MAKTKDLSPSFRLPKAESELFQDPNQQIGSQSGGLSFFNGSFKRGYGNAVFGSDVRGIWLGAADWPDAPFRVDMEGNATLNSAIITGMGMNFSSDIVWTATSRYVADWSAGSIKTSDGTTYAIDAGGTGTIAATTYIYLDPAVSITVLQQTTTMTTSAGQGKILIAVVQIGSVGSESVIDVIGSSGTTISGARIVTGTITATKLSVSTLDAISANIGNITAGTLAGVTVSIGSGNAIFKADSNGIYLGNATFASAPFRVTMAGAVTASSLTLTNASVGSGSSYTGNAISESYIGNLSAGKITTGTLSADRIGAGTITATKLSVSTLSAITADLGTVTAGNINGLTIDMPRSSTGGGSGTTGYLKWGGQSKMWSDTNNQIGINSIGSPMYVYVSNTEKLIIPSSGQLTLRGGAYLDGNVNVTGDIRCNKIMFNQSSVENNLDYVDTIKGYNDLRLQAAGASPASSWIQFVDNDGNYQGYFDTYDGEMNCGFLTETSDIRIKKNIKDRVGDLENVKKLRTVDYTNKNSNQKRIGLIAQEVELILPDLVVQKKFKGKDGKIEDGMKAVAYTQMIPILINAVQELSKKVDDLQVELKNKSDIKIN